jgi:hypothetical protein
MSTDAGPAVEDRAQVARNETRPDRERAERTHETFGITRQITEQTRQAVASVVDQQSHRLADTTQRVAAALNCAAVPFDEQGNESVARLITSASRTIHEFGESLRQRQGRDALGEFIEFGRRSPMSCFSARSGLACFSST